MSLWRSLALTLAILLQCAESGNASESAQPLLWIADGALTTQAQSLLAEMRAADRYGLRPADYAAESDEGARHGTSSDSANADLAISRRAQRFVHDLHFGRVDPARVGFALGGHRSALDTNAVLTRLAHSSNVRAELAAIEPPFLHYQLLKAALQRYLDLAQDPKLEPLPPWPGAMRRLPVGFAGIAPLRRLLVALGDLPAVPGPGAGRDDSVVDEQLATGVRSFQSRHGLTADGVIGRKTWSALQVPLAARAHQIALTLERWRWLPPLTQPPIIVNIPQFRLFAFRTVEDRAADVTQIPVIVGRAWRERRTPVFLSELRQVVFRPYWDVPTSIVRNEMLAPMRADPDFMARSHLELVAGPGDDGRVVPGTPENIEKLALGQLRLRQQPGADNALGLVKFVMPNDYGVYLHDTPADSLFARARRDFSHGCIRVGDPVALAVHVLRGNGTQWTATAVTEAMNAAASRRVTLAAPIPVMVLYGTALATEAGPVLFFDDIYGHDRRLDALLRSSKPGSGRPR